MEFHVSIQVSENYDIVELRVYSQRNQVISKDSDANDKDPNKNAKLFARAFDGMYNTDLLFPVLDIVMDAGMQGVLTFDHTMGGWYKVNPMFDQQKYPIMPVNIIPAEKLEWWENWIYYSEPNSKVRSFYIRKQWEGSVSLVEQTFRTFSNGWSGRVEAYGISGESEVLLEKIPIELVPVIKIAAVNKDDLSRSNLVNTLQNSIGYLFDSIDENPDSPMYRGMNLFYDYDAKTYRQKYWLWTYAPSIQSFIRAMDIPECAEHFGKEVLLSKAQGLGDVAVAYQELDASKPHYGLMLCRYDFSVFNMEGYDSKYSPADGLMLAGIGMLPLYQKTGDERYLNFVKVMVEATGEILKLDTIVQQDYYPVMESWKTNTVNESGFGMEGIADLYQLTQEESYREIGETYIEQLIAYLENEEGLWDKNYFRHSDLIDPNDFLTRGMAWAMMGITSAYRMNENPVYLEKSRVMARSLIDFQQEDGSWSFYCNQSPDINGVSEKGTAAWCYLFYRMYRMTQESVYLETARKALKWLLNNQYYKEDVQGHAGIPAQTPHSGVLYRAFYKISCSYTVSFFTMAILEELELQETI